MNKSSETAFTKACTRTCWRTWFKTNICSKSTDPRRRTCACATESWFYVILPCSAAPEGFFIPIKSWLNEEMRENKDMTPQDAGEMHAFFERTIKLAYDIFGDCAFRPT